jgi:hypothetical protein
MNYLSILSGIWGAVILESIHAAIDNFQGGETGWTSTLRDSLLRTDWNPSSCTSNRWPEDVRPNGALSPRRHPARAANRFYTG